MCIRDSPSFRLQLRHLLAFLCFVSISIYFLTSDSGPGAVRLTASQRHTAKLTSLCPYSTSRRHVPTVLLQGSQASDRAANRTVAVLDPQSSGGDKPAAFLPFAYPPRDLRFAQTVAGAASKARPGAGRLTEGVHPDDERGEQLCKLYRVPSSPRPAVPTSWKDSSVMFGMSTLADRVLWNLPVWAHWLPHAPTPPLDPENRAVVRELPLVSCSVTSVMLDRGRPSWVYDSRKSSMPSLLLPSTGDVGESRPKDEAKGSSSTYPLGVAGSSGQADGSYSSRTTPRAGSESKATAGGADNDAAGGG